MIGEEFNETIHQNLACLVLEQLTGQPFDMADVKIGPLEINYFSVVFFIEVSNTQGVRRVFVKIPKDDLRRGSKSILPISPADRHLSKAETDSLRILADQWQSDDLNVSWVNLRGEVPEYNAIVTDAIEGYEALNVFRRWDLRRRFGHAVDRDRLRSAMARLGGALGRFHNTNSKTFSFRTNHDITKLECYCREIGLIVHSRVLAEVRQTLCAMSGWEIDSIEVPTLKGIDIRNVLINDQDSIFLLDPGRMKSTCREADLARFIMTYRILYWGSKLFLLGLKPDMKAEQSFFEAYYRDNEPVSQKLHSFFMIKEQIKHWHTALDSLRIKSWPLLFKRLVAALYVNPYYSGQLKKELKELKKVS